jgi:DMATS type aromatic prenyltransferase
MKIAPDLSRVSFAGIIEEKLDKALNSLGIGLSESVEFRRGLQGLISEWGQQPVGSGSRREYFASNDGAPFEFSFAWSDRGVEIRFGCEEATDHASPLTRQEAAANLTRQLANRTGVSIDRYLTVEDLFVTPVPPKPFSIGHVIAWQPGDEPTYKIYLNPAASGRERTAATVAEAAERLGMAAAWRSVSQVISRQEKPDDLAAFALDLIESAHARAKVYLTRPDFSAADLEQIAQLSPEYQPGKIPAALKFVHGTSYTTVRKPCMICLSFTSSMDTLASMNFYVPLDPNLPSDAEALPVVSALMRHEGIDPSGHEQVIDALRTDSLRHSHMQSWVSLQASGRPRVTVYVGPELYRSNHD